MRPLSAAELLNAWEWGQGRSPLEQALLLLAAACPETPPEALAALSIGQRDARLLTLREWLFGAEIASVAGCPRCGERLDLTFTVADIRVAAPETTTPLALHTAGYDLAFRLPNSLDLAALAACPDVETGRALLFTRCLLNLRQGETDLAPATAPAAVMTAVVTEMAAADPQADVQMALACPQCRHEWQQVFDILTFLWAEIGAWVPRILRAVHTLAAAYGWAEADILAMSPWRRQYYLDLIGG